MMPACGHEGLPFGSPLCAHLRTCREPWIDYVRWYTGSGMDMDLLCFPCAEERERGILVETARVCQVCFEYATEDVGDPTGARGRPEILSRAEPIDIMLKRSSLSPGVGAILDIAPINSSSRSTWLLLADGGALIRFEAETEAWRRVAEVTVPLEPEHEPWAGHTLRRRLHVSSDGSFAAVVNDYGRYGQVLDLGSGQVTMELNGGDYHSETVPFSFAFAEVEGRVVAVHRTAWNRLDVSDARTGALLTDRGPTSYERGDERPEHYLDYFHGALYVSPNGTYIADDGWVWHPVGVVTAWSLERWVSGNAWESEDGSTKKDLCARFYYWDHAVTWIDDRRVAVAGIGDDDEEMVHGARIFDLGVEGRQAQEVSAFAGPAGTFFSDGTCLYSSDEGGLSRWDLADGVRTGRLPDFQPTRHHTGVGELAQVRDGALVRWSIREPGPGAPAHARATRSG